GKLAAVAVTSPERVGWAADVPTVAETSGMTGYAVTHWVGIMVPAKTPSAIVQRLQADFAAVLKEPEVRTRLNEIGCDPVGDSTAAFKEFLA
ncbi:tripartite tricarboxylate transporter substrate-binding protein, partial [Escherichia coli]|nr:tripartite tricarboxylate transporter substrate-binding protein [Escherichia coli]